MPHYFSDDQVVQANAANKMLAILGSMGAVEVTSEEIEKMKIDKPDLTSI